MARITGLSTFPLTGGRARSHQRLEVGPCGAIEDRLFVLYAPHDERGFVRVNQKHQPRLAQFAAEVVMDQGQPVLFRVTHDGDTLELPIIAAGRSDTRVYEYGEYSPGHDQGDEVAAWFARHLGMQSVRLMQKTLDWQRGVGRNPATTKVAPLHMITEQTVAAIDARIPKGRHLTTITHDRFRPNIVIDAPEQPALVEHNMQSMMINGTHAAVLEKVRDTQRCVVPGIDQTTGQQMRDVAFTYRNLPQSQGNAVVGAYLAPQIELGQTTILQVGDDVDIVL